VQEDASIGSRACLGVALLWEIVAGVDAGADAGLSASVEMTRLWGCGRSADTGIPRCAQNDASRWE
jgi:hypothetical protein